MTLSDLKFRFQCRDITQCQITQKWYQIELQSSSRMRVMNHNWSATKQRLHPQCSWDKPPFSFVRGHDSTMWDIVWVSPQGHRSVSVSRHFLLQAPQCPCSVQKRLSRDHCYRGRSKSGCRIVGSHTSWELTTWADFQSYNLQWRTNKKSYMVYRTAAFLMISNNP